MKMNVLMKHFYVGGLSDFTKTHFDTEVKKLKNDLLVMPGYVQCLPKSLAVTSIPNLLVYNKLYKVGTCIEN